MVVAAALRWYAFTFPSLLKENQGNKAEWEEMEVPSILPCLFSGVPAALNWTSPWMLSTCQLIKFNSLSRLRGVGIRGRPE